jgi:hypothetical protein
MFEFNSYKCFPKSLVGKYFIDWSGYGNESVSFDITYSTTQDGVYQFISSTSVPGVEVELDIQNLNFFEDVWFIIEARRESGEVIAKTQPFFSGRFPNKIDRLAYREIMRRTELDLKRFLGKRKGLLLRRRTFGERASNVNPVLDIAVGLDDEDSFGQKYEGGYLPPVEMICGYIQNERGVKDSKVMEQGVTDVRTLGLVTMPFPVINTNDIWVNLDTNDRYVFSGQIKTPTFSGLPIKQISTVSLLPRDDKAYLIEL